MEFKLFNLPKKNAGTITDNEISFSAKISSFVNKIDKAIKNFRFNVAIALFYEVYKIFKDKIDTGLEKNTLVKNITIIMKLMLPFITTFSK